MQEEVEQEPFHGEKQQQQRQRRPPARKGELSPATKAFWQYLEEDPDNRKLTDRSKFEVMYKEWADEQDQDHMLTEAGRYVGPGTALHQICHVLKGCVVHKNNTIVWLDPAQQPSTVDKRTRKQQHKNKNKIKPVSYAAAAAMAAAESEDNITPTPDLLVARAIHTLLQQGQYMTREAAKQALRQALKHADSPLNPILAQVFPDNQALAHSLCSTLAQLGVTTPAQLSMEKLESALITYNQQTHLARKVMQVAFGSSSL